MVAWEDLPQRARQVVIDSVGPVSRADTVERGQASDLAVVLHREEAAPVFLKGVHGVSPQMRWLRNESRAAAHTGGLAPSVLFSHDTERWLLVGFQHLPGRAATLTPDSTDLALIAQAVNILGSQAGHEFRGLDQRFEATDWWKRIADTHPEYLPGELTDLLAWSQHFPQLATGNRLVHTDLHGQQFLINQSDIRIVDWGYPGNGAAWVDPAFLILRLIEAGHAPEHAEAWAHQHLAHPPSATQLTAFTVYIAGLWTQWTITGNPSGSPTRAQLARDYASRRLAMTAGNESRPQSSEMPRTKDHA